MLNSTSNRLRADYDSRRRSSTGRLSLNGASGAPLRQVHRIYDDEYFCDDDNRERKYQNFESLGNDAISNSIQIKREKDNSYSKEFPPRRPSELPLSIDYDHQINRKKHQPRRRKSGMHYSIANKVHPMHIPQKSEKKLSGRRRNSTSQPKVAKERRGSRHIRYSIAKRIKSHREEQNDENPDDSFVETKNFNMDLLRHSNQLPRPCFIILPSNKYRVAWDVFMAWLLAILAFYIPFRFCMYFFESTKRGSGIFWFESSVDIIFAFDILINFVTAYHDPSSKCIVCNPKRIAMKYLKGYFILDLIATLPINYFLSSSSGNLVANKLGKLGRLPKMVRFLKAVRLLKLLRVYRLKDFITKLETEYNIHHGITRMIKILATVLLVTHLAGCFWHLVGLTSGDDIYDGGWIYRYSFQNKSVLERYCASLYWAFSTLTTVGYGDISARGVGEQIYSMAMMLVGVSWYAYIVSSMATIMSSFDALSAAIREKMVCVNEFIRAGKLPNQLGKQVRSYFEFKLANSQKALLLNKHFDADEILYELNSSLRAEIMLFMERDLVARIPFFQNKVNQFVADTVAFLQPIVCHKGEFIVKEGSQADEMFFLTRGKASVLYGNKHVFTLEEGDYFGEIGCLVGGIRRAGVKALTTCELQALSRRNLNTLIMEYPDVGEELKRVAKDRSKIVREEKKSKMTVTDDNKGNSGSSLLCILSDEAVDRKLQLMMEELKANFESRTQEIKQKSF